jgi:hypothetical protein
MVVQHDSVPRSLFNTAFGLYPSTLDSLPPMTLTMTHPVLEVLDGGVTPDTTHTARPTATGPISPAALSFSDDADGRRVSYSGGRVSHASPLASFEGEVPESLGAAVDERR